MSTTTTLNQKELLDTQLGLYVIIFYEMWERVFLLWNACLYYNFLQLTVNRRPMDRVD